MSYVAEILADSPVGYWKLDELSGAAEDQTANNNDGTITGALTGEPTNLSEDTGFSMSFDGIDDIVNFFNPTLFQLSTGTLEAWVKVPKTGAGSSFRGIFVKQGAFGLFANDNILSAYDWVGGVMRSTGKNIADGLWHHVAMSFQLSVTNGSIIYLDSVAVLTTTVGMSTQGSNIGVGTNPGSAGQNIKAHIDEPAIYDYLVSQQRLAAHYEAARPAEIRYSARRKLARR